MLTRKTTYNWKKVGVEGWSPTLPEVSRDSFVLCFIDRHALLTGSFYIIVWTHPAEPSCSSRLPTRRFWKWWSPKVEIWWYQRWAWTGQWHGRTWTWTDGRTSMDCYKNKQGIRWSPCPENWYINYFNVSDYVAIIFYAFWLRRCVVMVEVLRHSFLMGCGLPVHGL